jgi:hypothetical protein
MIALPMLDAMLPRARWRLPREQAPSAWLFSSCRTARTCRTGLPRRKGADFDLPLHPSATPGRTRSELYVLSGLAQDKGRAQRRRRRRSRALGGSWLTCSQPLKSEGSQIRVGISADQVARSTWKTDALRFARTRPRAGRQGGKCDSGYSCAYSNNISWRNERPR